MTQGKEKVLHREEPIIQKNIYSLASLCWMSMVWRFAPQFDKEAVEGVLTNIDKVKEVCVGGSCYTASLEGLGQIKLSLWQILLQINKDGKICMENHNLFVWYPTDSNNRQFDYNSFASNGQTEVANKFILKGVKTKILEKIGLMISLESSVDMYNHSKICDR